MEMVEAHRKECLQQQTELRRIIMKPGQFNLALDLFLNLHARLHSRKMVQAEPWSLEDEILDDMAEERVRRIPPGECHSVAWLIWHIARCEDVTMNLLVAGTPQVLNGGGLAYFDKQPAV
jgi:hypothetical protein